MKQIFLFTLALVLGFTSFAQKEKKNGTIYMTHPYIDAVNNATKAYVANDMKLNASFFADSATVWVSGMEKFIPVSEALALFGTDHDYYKDIKVTQTGYPDFLHYTDKDQLYVQSWWTWSGISKKTGQEVKIPCVQFDQFNSAGKIVREMIYGDFSKMVKE